MGGGGIKPMNTFLHTASLKFEHIKGCVQEHLNHLILNRLIKRKIMYEKLIHGDLTSHHNHTTTMFFR